MVKITKVYTRTGDLGETGLVGNARVAKSSMRIQTMGAIDELNTMLGLAIAQLSETLHTLSAQLQRIQHELFDLGAALATINHEYHYEITEEVLRLENEIDQMNETLPILHSFILPGGHIAAAQLQVARTICRRAEQVLVALTEESDQEKPYIVYVNRLSDWLFVAARFVNARLGTSEPLWVPKIQRR